MTSPPTMTTSPRTTSDEDEDPYEAFRSELRSQPGKWYVIHSYAGFERKVKANIEQRKSTLEVEEDIYQIEVPMEDVVEIKNGQRKMVTRVRIPGYVLVRMELNEDTWSVVRHTPGVTGFVGNAHNPTPLRFEEAFTMLKSPRRGQGGRARQGRRPSRRSRGRPRHPRRGRLRGRRDDHDQGRLLRGPARHDQRDQARERQAHGPRLALRARDPGRAVVRPGHQALTLRVTTTPRQVLLAGRFAVRARMTRIGEADTGEAGQTDAASRAADRVRICSSASRSPRRYPIRQFRNRPSNRAYAVSRSIVGVAAYSSA